MDAMRAGANVHEQLHDAIYNDECCSTNLRRLMWFLLSLGCFIYAIITATSDDSDDDDDKWMLVGIFVVGGVMWFFVGLLCPNIFGPKRRQNYQRMAG